MWIKTIAPLLAIQKIFPASFLYQKGEICAKHFRENDCDNLKIFYSTRCNTHFESNDLLPQLSEIYANDNVINNKIFRKRILLNVVVARLNFNLFLHLLILKQVYVIFKKMTDEKTENLTCGKVPSDTEESSDDKLSLNHHSLQATNDTEGIIQLMDESIPSGTLSIFIGTNEIFITNPIELTELTDELLLAPVAKNKSDLVLTSDNAENFVVPMDAKVLPDNLILTCPMLENKGNNELILTAEVTNNASVINFEPQCDEIHEINFNENDNLTLQNDMILEIQYGSDGVMKKNKIDKIKTKLSCSYCGKLFEKPFNLQQHERVHTGERPFQCVICGRAFSQKANVRKHMIRHKVWPQAKQTLKIKKNQGENNSNYNNILDRTSYSCQYCSMSFSSYSLHKKHLVVHSDFKVYRCIQKGCDETFSDLDEFLCHSESHSSAEFQCHVCLKIFKSLEELGAHQYDHDLPNRIKKDFNIKLKCQICHAQFKSAESLKNHIAVDTHNYECPHCKSVFSCERFLRRHLATHSDPTQSKFECEYCKKTFRTQKYLNNHSFIHSKIKPFKCELCSKQFASKYRLKRHLAIHMSQYLECPLKPYLGCDKKFYRKDKLRNHISTHCHFKIRLCYICSKTFTSFVKLQQHMKTDHNLITKKQVLKCINCSQTFRKQKQLLQHHCTVGEKKFKSRVRQIKKSENGKPLNETDNPEMVSNIEIIMVPYTINNDNT